MFPEGATIVKEPVLMHEGDCEDGSREEPSGRGFFANRFADTNGWGFFNFGHHAPSYAETATAAECASCHADNATTEMVFGKFYPILGLNRGWGRV